MSDTRDPHPAGGRPRADPQRPGRRDRPRGRPDVVGTAGSVAEALAAYDELKPDVVVADLQLQDGTGLDIVRAIRKRATPRA